MPRAYELTPRYGTRQRKDTDYTCSTCPRWRTIAERTMPQMLVRASSDLVINGTASARPSSGVHWEGRIGGIVVVMLLASRIRAACVGGVGLAVACSSSERSPSGGEPLGRVASAVTQGPWSTLPAGSSPPEIASHTATSLSDTKVLVLGGINALGEPTDQAMLLTFDPQSKAVNRKPVGRLAQARAGHSASALANGRILVVGGEDMVAATMSAELIDPGIGMSGQVAPMSQPRTRHGAAVLPDGKVLVMGGRGLDPIAFLSTAEVFDPAAGTWSAAPPMREPRYFVTATTLKDGKILVVGTSGKPSSVGSAEVYDPATSSWRDAGTVGEIGYGQIATLLPSGKVFVAGGFPDKNSVAIFDPATGVFTKGPPMPVPRGNATATTLKNGLVLVAGGRIGLTPLTYVDLFDEKTSTWASATPMILPHTLHTASLVGNGDVMIVGSAVSELFSFLPGGGACTRAADCGTGFCVDGVCCATVCTGACERCDTNLAIGTCQAVSGEFNHCAPGNTCIDNACTPSAGTTCSEDRQGVVSKDGKTTSCSPYVCDKSVGVCGKSCATSNDCAGGSVCNTSTKQCTSAPAGGATDEGGCSMGAPHSRQPTRSSLSSWSLLALALLVARQSRSVSVAERDSRPPHRRSD